MAGSRRATQVVRELGGLDQPKAFTVTDRRPHTRPPAGSFWLAAAP
jgi:hypothetical protein